MLSSCKWDRIECVLKASLSTKEQPLLLKFREGYRIGFNGSSCYPRLHIVTYEDVTGRAASLFSGIPNVTVRANQFSPIITEARHPLDGKANYYMAQWHALWADNFTTAPFVLFFDTDAIPVMPIRCHHLFDASSSSRSHPVPHRPAYRRVLWRSWLWKHSSAWASTCTAIFYNAHAHGERLQRKLSVLTRGVRNQHAAETLAARRTPLGPPLRAREALSKAHVPTLDMMAVFPIVIPRVVLPEVRRLTLRFFGGNATCFDEAFVRLGWPSHADLIGKTMLVQFPHLVTQVHCPSPLRNDDEGEPFVNPYRVATGRANASSAQAGVTSSTTSAATSSSSTASSTAHATASSSHSSPHSSSSPSRRRSCRTFVSPVEHMRHPIQNCVANKCKYLTPHAAAQYASRLMTGARRYATGGAASLPADLFMYNQDVITSEREREELSRETFREDPPGEVCGLVQ